MEISIEDLKQLLACTNGQAKTAEQPFDNGMLGEYVLVRCRDAGVHAGYLESHNGRECVLTEARRLWYWKPADGSAFLSGVVVDGLDDASKIGKPVPRLHLTENCEIALCTSKAAESIQAKVNHNE